jgi:hypothetical protein
LIRDNAHGSEAMIDAKRAVPISARLIKARNALRRSFLPNLPLERLDFQKEEQIIMEQS